MAAAAARGIDISGHVSSVATAELLSQYEAIIVFDRYHVSRARRMGVPMEKLFWLGDFDPDWVGKRAIVDPWGKSAAEFERTFDRIDRCAADAVEIMKALA